ncbi:MAG: exported protein of unknown function [Nitrospira sp.]|jgi:hypothetical protein|nr:exported protein of unknown function [Nitrospira sp.]
MRTLAIPALLAFLALLALSACSASRGLNRQALQESFHTNPDVVTDQDIAATMALQADLPSPYRLALYFKHKDFPSRPALRKVDWISADAERLQRALAPVKEEGIIRQSFLLANSAVQGTTFRDIRQAAARYNADAILVIDGAASVDRYNNGHSWWYATGLGLYLAHGTESHALFMMEGLFWDVRSGYLYGTQTAEGETTLIGPALLLEDKDAIAEAKDVALERFGKELADMLRLLREKQRVRQ